MSENMTTHEEAVYHRPAFNPEGRVVVRGAALRFGERDYLPSEPLDAADRAQLDERSLRVLWEQKRVDTLPPEVAPPKGVVAKIKGIARAVRGERSAE